MRTTAIILAMGVAVGLSAVPAAADWNPGDGHKMHYPQLPDPEGWDVKFTDPIVLADDWRCSRNGPVDDVHFWFSSRDDQQFEIQNVHVSIHEDDRTGAYSKPGVLRWERDFGPAEIVVRQYGDGQQGWIDPLGDWMIDDHSLYHQVNITKIRQPFTQEEGKIYWLDLHLYATLPARPTSPSNWAGRPPGRRSSRTTPSGRRWSPGEPPTGVR